MKKSRAHKNLVKRLGDPLRVVLEVEHLPDDTWECQSEKIFGAILECASSLMGRPVDEIDFCHTNLSAEFGGISKT